MEIRTSVIPSKQHFANLNEPHDLHFEAICVFVAIGFFLDQDTYWRDQIVLRPGFNYQLIDNIPSSGRQWFKWQYKPREISFDQALNEFGDLLENIIRDQVQNQQVILPLSGGLDSRTQAVALRAIGQQVYSYSYSFSNGYKEAKIAEEIAKQCAFQFKEFKINPGYLWHKIDDLASLNQCYSDFTSPRQMAISGHFESMGDMFSLGHWGDVLFDNMGLPELNESDQVEVLIKKLTKKGGLELATKLWKAWLLPGDFKSYLKKRITDLLHKIKIDNTNARLRAFKSMYWAPRWTAVNLSVFEAAKPISLPYFDDRMCQFICGLPEKFLHGRQLQIEYIRKNAPDLAKITWQDQRPFNLNNFQRNRMPFNLPYRIKNKIIRTFGNLTGNSYVQRNWELQFIGQANQLKLRENLFAGTKNSFVPFKIVEETYEHFLKDTRQYAHGVNMLLVLSKFNQLNTNA